LSGKVNMKDKTNKNIVMSNINNVRKDLMDLRFMKAQKKKFISSVYRKKRKLLARLLTNINK